METEFIELSLCNIIGEGSGEWDCSEGKAFTQVLPFSKEDNEDLQAAVTQLAVYRT